LRSRRVWTQKFRSLIVPGSVPAIAPDESAYDALFARIRSEGGDRQMVFMFAVPTSHFLWTYLRTSREIRKQWLMYLPLGIREFHTIDLPDSMEAYLAKFSSKSRYNLRREMRVLAEQGKLRLERVEHAEKVPAFLKNAEQVSGNSWQQLLLDRHPHRLCERTGMLSAIAERGALRSYVLHCGDEPCAVAAGFQLGGVFHFLDTAYSQSYSSRSPGRCLIYHIIQDLIEHNRPRTFYFGTGDMGYKDWFANAGGQDATVILFRRTIANRFWRTSHAAWERGIDIAKRLIRRRVTTVQEGIRRCHA
jgi:hypothetical protein